MATPKCGYCKSSSSELQEIIPIGSNYKLYSINCASCGAIFGVLEHYSTVALVDKLEKKINDLKTIGLTHEDNLWTVKDNLRSIGDRIDGLPPGW